MAYGDIGAPQDTLMYEPTDIKKPDMVHVSGDIFAIAYENASGNGAVITIDITAAGAIGAAVIDSLEFDAVDGHEVKIIHVLGDIFAIAYRGPSSHGYLVTVEISTAGAMGAAVEDTLEFDTSACYEPDPIMRTDSIIAVVYRYAANQGKIITATIEASGQISAAVIDEEHAWASNCNAPSVANVTNSIFAIAYRDNAYDGHVCTMSIDAAGQIGATVEDTLEIDAVNGNDPRICKVYDDIFAIAYRGPGDDGWLCTVTISSAGAIGATVEDTLEFDITRCVWPDIIHLGRGIVAIAYEGEFQDGFVITAQIETDGQIGAAVIDSEEYDISQGIQPSIVHVSGDQYAIAYRGVASYGFIKTPTIETPPVGRPGHLMLMGVG
jgi:hypothetical protein